MSIDLRYCPPEAEGVCEYCDRWTARSVIRGIGARVFSVCRDCRGRHEAHAKSIGALR